MKFLGRWLSHSLATALALILAILAMQAPAFTRGYADALLEVASDARRDIDQREASARQFYGIAAERDDDLVQILQTREPSNAATLTQSLARVRVLRQAYDDITSAAPLLQPMIALGGAIDDRDGYKEPIWGLLLDRYSLQLELSVPALVYGLAGLMLGSLLAQSLLALLRAGSRRRSMA